MVPKHGDEVTNDLGQAAACFVGLKDRRAILPLPGLLNCPILDLALKQAATAGLA